MIFSVVLGVLSPVRGQSVWQGAADSLWSNPANWTGAGVPDGNAAWARFPDGAKNLNVTVDGTFTFRQLQFVNNGAGAYAISGGTLVFDKNGEGCGLMDASTRDNTISCNLTVSNSRTGDTPSSVISKIAPAGTLRLAGTVTTSSITVFHVPNKGRLVISGSLVGGEDPQPNAFNQQFQASDGGTITIEGPGVSTGPSGGTICISLGGDAGPGTMNLNRPASLAGGKILFINNASTSNSVINLGADNAIANDEGSLRTQVSVACESLTLNTNGHELDLSQKTFQLFPYGNPGVTLNLDLGDGASHLCFARSSSERWNGALVITHFTKGEDSIRFGTDERGLIPSQLARITINGAGGVEIDADGFLVVPE